MYLAHLSSINVLHLSGIILLLQGGYIALIVSASGGDYETVKVLLDNGADPNIDREFVDYVSPCIVSIILIVH